MERQQGEHDEEGGVHTVIDLRHTRRAGWPVPCAHTHHDNEGSTTGTRRASGPEGATSSGPAGSGDDRRRSIGLAGGCGTGSRTGWPRWAEVAPEGPVRVTRRLSRVLTARLIWSPPGGPRVISEELARGSLVDALFRQWVTTGRWRIPGPMRSGRWAGGDTVAIAAFVETLPADAAGAGEEIASTRRASWPLAGAEPMWLPRPRNGGGALVADGSS